MHKMKTLAACEARWDGGEGESAEGTRIMRMQSAQLPAALRRLRPLTVLIAQRDRGGLRRWPSLPVRPDIVVTVLDGDSAARAVALSVRANAAHGWPLLCIVMGAAHAHARIDAAARKAYGSDVCVMVVEGP